MSVFFIEVFVKQINVKYALISKKYQ